MVALAPVTPETPFFFGPGSTRLFGVYHEPHGETRREPFVFCHPFGEEKLWSHRVFVSFARQLAQLGHAVLRFDYAGNGDSDGSFENSTVASMERDIDAAIEEVKRRTGSDRVGLLGARFGASVAARTADRRADVSRLVLWAPILNGAAYLQELLRINLTTQLAVYREVRDDREALGQRLAAGENVNVDGYELGPAMARELGALSLSEGPARFAGDCLIVHVDRAGRMTPDLERFRERYASATLIAVQEDLFWKEIQRFYDAAPNLFAATREWLESRRAL